MTRTTCMRGLAVLISVGWAWVGTARAAEEVGKAAQWRVPRRRTIPWRHFGAVPAGQESPAGEANGHRVREGPAGRREGDHPHAPRRERPGRVRRRTAVAPDHPALSRAACRLDASPANRAAHMGRPSQVMEKFVDVLAEQDLKAKNVAIFGTYAGNERLIDRAVKKLEKIAAKKLPKLTLILWPGLSVRVHRMPGPIFEGELPKCVDSARK